MIKQQYISRRFDEAAILSTLGKLAFTDEPSLDEGDYAVLAALRRSSPDWNLPVTETAERLSGYSDDQISGLVNNVKGILHEMEFQRLENEDGDSVIAAIYPDTNHRSVDIQLLDQNTGDALNVQLKATDSVSAINEWMESNPDTEIVVTEELAEKMDLPSSGFSNEELTIRVEDFVDRMLEIGEDHEEAIWDYFPPLVAASSAIILIELFRRYRNGHITFERFKTLTARTIGIKATKYAAVFAALSVPGLNFLVAVYLLGSLIYAVNGMIGRLPEYKPFTFLQPRRDVNGV